jgi:SAM-dependent methyltransferase
MYAAYADVHAKEWLEHNPAASNGAPKPAYEAIAKCLPKERAARILELGCGDGTLLSALRSAGYQNVMGVDLSPQAIALSKEKGVNVEEGDAAGYLTRSSQTLDCCIAVDIFEHMFKDELLVTLDLIHRRLADGGVLILRVPNAMTPWMGHYRYGDLTHEMIFNWRSICSVLLLCGFKDVTVSEVALRVHGLKSAVRYVLWKAIWCGCALWNLIETGSICGGVYTRNLIATAYK